MSADPTPGVADFIRAADACSFLGENLALHFRATEATMTREQAKRNLATRASLVVAQQALLDEAERLNEAAR